MVGEFGSSPTKQLLGFFIMKTKICRSCKIEKDIIDFGSDKNKKDKKSIYCKECSRIKAKDWAASHKDRISQYNKMERKKNYEKSLLTNRAHYQNNKAMYAANSLKNRYGLSQKQFENMREVTNCPICKREAVHEYDGRGCKSGKIVVDHDHKTNKVRGFICSYCNVMLGNAKDNIQTLQNAIKYLEQHQVTG